MIYNLCMGMLVTIAYATIWYVRIPFESKVFDVVPNQRQGEVIK